MFHVISARLARLARRTRSRLAIPGEYATWHGWETRKIGLGTVEFRDPRFRHLAAIRAAQAASSPAAPSWAQEAITGRIRALGTGPAGRDISGRGA